MSKRAKSFEELSVLGDSVTMPMLQQTVEQYAQACQPISVVVVIEIIRRSGLLLNKADAAAILASARKGALKMWQSHQHLPGREWDDLVHLFEDALEALEKVDKAFATSVGGFPVSEG